MKKSLMMAMLSMVCTMAIADDVIVYRSGDVERGKVEEISRSSVKYRKASNPDGPVYTIDKRDLLSIQYENGSVDYLSDPIEKEEETPAEVDNGKSLRFCPKVGMVLGTRGSGGISGGGGVEFIANFKVNDYLKMGPGTGMMGHSFDERFDFIEDVSTFEIPVFFNVQFNFTKGAVSPYVVGQVGYNFGSVSYFQKSSYGYYDDSEDHLGMFGKVAVGIDFNLKRGAIYCDLGYKAIQWSIDDAPSFAEFCIGYRFRK